MRIAQVAPLIERIPPKKYGGTERVVHALTEELVRRGHDVTLFASGDSITSAKLVPACPRSLRETKAKDVYGPNALTLYNLGEAYARRDEFDIIHDHNGCLSLPTAQLSRTPVVMTVHGPFSPETLRLFRALRKPHLVAVARWFLKTRGLNYAGAVYNGLPMEQYPFSERHERYLLFVGRISAEKGVHNAIALAKRLRLPLIIAAKLDDVDRVYFKTHVEPHLSKTIQWVGEVDEAARNKLMSKALCFVHAITWNEPFGLTLIEAMACGCPVVAFAKGSIPEIVVHGKTGFAVDTMEEMEKAVFSLDTIGRAECRRHALRNFSAEKMADGYEAVYRKILSHMSRSPAALERSVIRSYQAGGLPR